MFHLALKKIYLETVPARRVVYGRDDNTTTTYRQMHTGRTKEQLIKLQSEYENICKAGFEGNIEDYIGYLNNYGKEN